MQSSFRLQEASQALFRAGMKEMDSLGVHVLLPFCPPLVNQNLATVESANVDSMVDAMRQHQAAGGEVNWVGILESLRPFKLWGFCVRVGLPCPPESAGMAAMVNALMTALERVNIFRAVC